jgi:hypothetical protein
MLEIRPTPKPMIEAWIDFEMSLLEQSSLDHLEHVS